jgi:zinc protease
VAPADEDNPPGYAVVVSKVTSRDAAWQPVVAALVEKHQGSVVVFDSEPAESLDALRKLFPRYVCVVAKQEEVSRPFVAEVHRLMRKLDGDPYTDVLWGILTGYDAAGALKIARHKEPLIVRRVASGTEIELSACEEGVWYCELNQGHMVRKRPGGKPEAAEAPPDTTKALVDSLNEYQAQLFVTSGHATERDWQIGYRYRNGQFRSEAGKLFGLDTRGKRHLIDSPNPKVYLPVGNCLMGNINGPDAMALAWMHSAGVQQMIGYTVPTWYGYAGWGCLDYFVEQPGRFTLAEAFYANLQALIHRLETEFPGASTRGRGDARGLLFDRDVVAFYGDPAWEARMAPGPLAWEQSLEEADGMYTFTIRAGRGGETFQPINTNGSQRGWRPIIHLLPHRVRDVKILEGADLRPLVTDNFILVPNPRKCDAERAYRVRFQAARVE